MNMSAYKGNVLVLDDEKNIVTVVQAILEKRGFSTFGFTEPEAALHALQEQAFDAVVTDLYMPELDGMSFLKSVHKHDADLPVVMITAFGTVDSAVDAIKQGAFDYVTKPFEQSEITAVIEKAVNTRRLGGREFSGKNFKLALGQQQKYIAPLFLGQSVAIQRLQELLKKVSASPSSILITSEMGTGKEILVEEIHKNSGRSIKPLIKINCAALPSNELEEEIFGGKKPGRIEQADEGTLFLDEISEMGFETQIKLLHFIEEAKFENTVTRKTMHADVRIIAAAAINLADEVKAGRFREDLYYKLNIVPIYLPALREREDDLKEIIPYFIERISKRLGKNVTEISKDCLKIFQNYSWPGNFRQLENVLERMILLADGNCLTEKDIPQDLRKKGEAVQDSVQFRELIKKQTQDFEKELIEQTLRKLKGNVSKTAEHLNLSRKGLQLKMKELGIRHYDSTTL